MNQFARYIAVGITNTALGYAIIFALMYVAGWPPEASNVGGYAVGLLISYLLNRSYTFKSDNARTSEFARFIAVFAVAFGANFLALLLLLHAIHLPGWLAQLIAGVVYVGTSYLLNKRFVFARKP